MKHNTSILLAVSLLISMNGMAEAPKEPDARGIELERFDGIKAQSPVILEESPRVAFPGEPEAFFSELPESSWIDVEYSSEGSFVTGEWTLRVWGGNRPRVSIAGSSNFTNEPPPRELPLSADDLRGLDRLLSYYRSPPLDTDCTTKEEITFRLHRDGDSSSEVEIESFVDETCGDSRYDNILRLWDLVRRTEE